MTNFYATVFLPPTASEALVDAVTTAMAPYDLNREIYSDDWEWDSWRLIAPDGHFQLKPQYAPDNLPTDHNSLVAVPRFMIDFAAMRDRPAAHAAAQWDAWHALAAAHPPAQPLTAFAGLEPADAQTTHLAQPLVQAFAQLAVTQTHPYFTLSILIADPIAHFGNDRNEFIQRARDHAFATAAYVTLDGAWCGSTAMGFPTDAYVREMNAYLDGVPDDTMLAIVRCHA